MTTEPPSPEIQRFFAKRVIDALEQLGLPYAIGGSVAAMAYSEGRMTKDIDLMLAADLEKLGQLVETVTAWQIYIAPLESIIENDVPYGLPFNILDGSTGTRADCYVVRPNGLDVSAMSRRRQRRWDMQTEDEAWFLSPEDVILYKLDYFRQSEGVSQKHPKDILLMLAVIGDQLDLAYIEKWAAEIGVAEVWQAIWDEFQKPF